MAKGPLVGGICQPHTYNRQSTAHASTTWYIQALRLGLLTFLSRDPHWIGYCTLYVALGWQILQLNDFPIQGEMLRIKSKTNSNQPNFLFLSILHVQCCVNIIATQPQNIISFVCVSVVEFKIIVATPDEYISIV